MSDILLLLLFSSSSSSRIWLTCSMFQDWSPHMSFILKGSQISAFQLKGWLNPRRQSKNIKMTYKLILNLCRNYVVHVLSTMWRIKNQPSNCTSWSDNALRLLVVVAGRVYISRTSSDIFILNLGLRLKGCFLREVYFEGPNCIWSLQSWKLLTGTQNPFCFARFQGWKWWGGGKVLQNPRLWWRAAPIGNGSCFGVFCNQLLLSPMQQVSSKVDGGS